MTFNALTRFLILFLSFSTVGKGALAADLDIDVEIRKLAFENKVGALEPYTAKSPKASELGGLLFFDPLLSGNHKISCGTCHNPKEGLGTRDRLAPAQWGHEPWLPRNALPLFLSLIHI